MPISRYSKLKKINDSDGKLYIETPNQIKINTSDFIWTRWKEGDKSTIISNRYYGTPEYYWIILESNNKSLDSDFKIGEKIKIPRQYNTIVSNL